MRHNVGTMNQTSHDNLPGMTTLYDSDAFIVVHIHGLPAAEKNAEEL